LVVTESLVEKILGGRNMNNSSKTPSSFPNSISAPNSNPQSAAAAAQALIMLPGHSPRIGTALQRLQQINDNLNQILQLETLSARLFEFSVGGVDLENAMNTPSLHGDRLRRPSTSSYLNPTNQNHLSLTSPVLTIGRKASVPFATDDGGHQFFSDQL
jgi:hypothetical protein